MANNVTITGSDFSELYNALDNVAKRSAQAARFMSRMFNTDYANANVFASLDKLNLKLAETERLSRNAAAAFTKTGSIKPPSNQPNAATGDSRRQRRYPGSASVDRDMDGGNTIAPQSDFLNMVKKTAAANKKLLSQVLKDQYKQSQGFDVPENVLERNASAYAKKMAKVEQERQRQYDLLAKQVSGKPSRSVDFSVGPSKFVERIPLRGRELNSAAERALGPKDDLLKAVLKMASATEKIVGQVKSAQYKESKTADVSYESLSKKAAVYTKRYNASIEAQKNKEKERQAKAAKILADQEEEAAKESARQNARMRSQYSGVLSQYKRVQMAYQKATYWANNIISTEALKKLKDMGSPDRWISKFGNPGQMPLFTRFRVFQRPFPGSERNPFALGDANNVLNNAIYGTTRALSGFVSIVTAAGSDLTKTFGNIVQVGISAFASIFKFVPYLGKILAGPLESFAKILNSAAQGLGDLIGVLGDAFGQLINSLGMLTLGLAGFASRAVQAASNLTELKNAAMVYVGQIGGQRILQTATDYQQQYGLSASDSLRLMTRVAGQYRQTTGASQEVAAAQAQDVFKAAADAGSVLNMSIDDIGKTIQSALAGRYTPLRRIGVSVSAPYLDQLAEAKGYTKDAKTPFEARIKALIDEIRRQTAPFLKDLEATQYEFANLQRKFLGQFESVFVQVGRALEPFARILLIVATELGDKVINKIKSFSDGIESLMDGLKQGVGSAFASSFYRNLVWFSKSVARVADYIHYFASTIYRNAGAIGENLKGYAAQAGDMGFSLVDYSLKMIELAAGFVASLGGIQPAIKSFAASLTGLAEWMDRNLGFGPKSQGEKSYDSAVAAEKDRVEKLNYYISKKTEMDKLLSSNKPVKPGLQYSVYAGKKQLESAEAKAFENLEVRLGVDKRIRNGMTKEQAIDDYFQIKPFQVNPNEDISNSVYKVTGDLREMLKGIKENGLGFLSDKLNVPKTFSPEGVLDKLLMQLGRIPGFADFENLESGQASSRYFSPAAFYDEIATRELNAAETTAQNTTTMAETMTGMLDIMKGQIAKPMDPQMFAGFTTS